MSMTYANRMTLAALVSALLHGAAIGVLQHTYVPAPVPAAPLPEPLVLNLQPPDPPPPPPTRQLVDVQVPADTPPKPVDRIAETHAEAMDLAARPDADASPALELDNFDALPMRAAPETPPEPAAPPPPEKTERKEEQKEAPEAIEETLPVEEIDAPLESVQEPDAVPDRQEPRPEAPIRIAQATPAPPQRPSPGTSRDRAGVSRQGVTNFDAIQNEIAPYLKHVRQLVERRWNEMLYTRYSGTSPVTAVIDCAINPQGELVSVTVVGPDGDRLYSALCKDAVRRAGPFGPFPFEVPDIYRDKNLEIRWTFNFL